MTHIRFAKVNVVRILKNVAVGILFLAFIDSFVHTHAQTQAQAEEMRRQRLQEALERRNRDISFARLRAISEQLYRGIPVPREAIKDVTALYREPTAKELEKLRPKAEDVANHAAFLRQGKTGIVRLVADAGCGDGTMVLAVAGPCMEYPMPGNGSSYSFREGNYRLRRLSDLRFVDGNFAVSGVLHHGLMTGIGDISLDKVQLNTKGLEHLNNFRPATQLAKAVEAGRELQNPVEKDGYYYARELRAVEQMTYVFRSVAYRGNVYRSIGGFVYDELKFDKRMDITVAFRIIRKHDDGSITVIWKEIARKPSPVLKRKKGEPARSDINRFLAKLS